MISRFFIQHPEFPCRNPLPLSVDGFWSHFWLQRDGHLTQPWSMRIAPVPGHSYSCKDGPIRTSEIQLWVFGPIKREYFFPDQKLYEYKPTGADCHLAESCLRSMLTQQKLSQEMTMLPQKLSSDWVIWTLRSIHAWKYHLAFHTYT